MKRYSNALDAVKIALARNPKNKAALKIQSASKQIQNAAEE
jgi:hypothetical protein